ncbi:phage baseplate assembly protein V [Vibrio diabolicus]|uniref:phage baseplate assembly protein V n=1 Tax=Vibrio diabolicus TaxID=50719 RepID=UPI0037511498
MRALIQQIVQAELEEYAQQLSLQEKDITELNRRLNNMIRVGKVSAWRDDHQRIKVKFGDNETPWVKWFSECAGDVAEYRLPSIGEQAVLLNVGGGDNSTTSIALIGIPSDQFPLPTDNPDEILRVYPDGTRVCYDKTVVLRAYGSGDDPVIKMITGVGDTKSIAYGFSVSTKALIAVVGCTIDTMSLDVNASVAWGSYGGFASRGSGEGQVGNMEIVLSKCKIRLRDHQLSAHYNRVDYSMRDVVVEHVGSFTSLVGRETGIASTFYVAISSLTITDGSKNIADLFYGISSDNSLVNFSLV